jgi:hypothetical protein
MQNQTEDYQNILFKDVLQMRPEVLEDIKENFLEQFRRNQSPPISPNKNPGSNSAVSKPDHQPTIKFSGDELFQIKMRQ